MKKLTAGIFTVLMGLVSVNTADAAVASKAYVDAKVGISNSSIDVLSQTVADNKTAADATANALSEYKTSNDAAVKKNADAIAAEELARANAVSGLDTRVTANATAIDGLESSKADKGTKLSDYGITDAYTKGETDDAIAVAVQGTMTGDVSTILGGYLKKSEAETIYESIATAKATNDAQDVKINANTVALTTLNGNDTVEGSVAKSIADAIAAANLGQYAKRADVEGALTAYTKTSELGALAMKDIVGTNDIDNLAVTEAKLANGAVSGNKIANGAVSDEKISAVSSSKVTGLAEELAEKMDITKATTTAGKYVLTANVSETGVADYAWEQIERGTDGE